MGSSTTTRNMSSSCVACHSEAGAALLENEAYRGSMRYSQLFGCCSFDGSEKNSAEASLTRRARPLIRFPPIRRTTRSSVSS